MSWADNLKYKPPTSEDEGMPLPDISNEKYAKSTRGLLIKHGLADFARDHGLMPKAAVATLEEFVTEDAAMREMKTEVVKLADLDESVIIFGESGTGKELIARALHGDRVGKFVGINCAAMPETLLESELFGHKAGAFTDAKQDKIGLLAQARDGTIFLDEIGEMPLKLQAKLLRALQERKVRRVGDVVDVDISCRVVSATNVELWRFEENTEHVITSLKQTFRLDLYWRLAVYKVHITPLRDRRDDIRELLDAKYDAAHLLTEDERDAIIARPLYGNVRELEALVKRAVLKKTISVEKKRD